MGASRRFRPKLYVLNPIAESMPAELRDAIALRNATNVAGRCPRCGATPELEDGTPLDAAAHCRPGTVTLAYYFHDDDCPATTASINEMLKGLGRSAG